jgi:hypothetical protein
MEYPDVVLEKIWEGEEKSLERLRTELVQKGWCRVVMPESLVKVIENVKEPLEKFFQLPLDQKEGFKWNYVFGFTSVTHKESFRWLTKDLYDPSIFPPDCKESLGELSQLMDKVMIDLFKSSSSVLFNNPDKLGKELDIPLLKSKDVQWSMLDVAYYFNNSQKFAESSLVVDENCAPHYDPGLLSLSILSTHIGLELFDPISQKWIPHTGEEKQIGIIWCGKAAQDASNGLLRPAVHKVIRQLDKPRMAIWYEICTANQVPEPARPLVESIVKSKSQPQSQTPQPKLIPTPNPIPKQPSRWDSIFNSFKSVFDSGDNEQKNTNKNTNNNTNKLEARKGIPPTKKRPNNNLRLTEAYSGIPMSKSGKILDRPPNKNLLKNEPFSGIPMTKSGIEMDWEDEPPKLKNRPILLPPPNNNINNNSNNKDNDLIDINKL